MIYELVCFLAGFLVGALVGIWFACSRIKGGVNAKVSSVLNIGSGGGPAPDR